MYLIRLYARRVISISTTVVNKNSLSLYNNVDCLVKQYQCFIEMHCPLQGQTRLDSQSMVVLIKHLPYLVNTLIQSHHTDSNSLSFSVAICRFTSTEIK